MPTPYPPAPPTVNGTVISVDAFLNNPARVQRTIERLTLNRFVADFIFAAGPPGSSVLYDQLLASDFFTARDVQEIEPGSEFPIVNSGEQMPKVAVVKKWGGAAVLTYEAVRRDNRALLNRELTRLRNTIIRKIDTVGMAVLDAAPIQALVGTGDWSVGTSKPLNDLEQARTMIDDADMGYVADTVMLNPAQRFDLRTRDDVRALLPREGTGTAGNPVLTKELANLAGYENWIVSNRITAGIGYVLAAKMIGNISDELPLYSRVIDQQERERYLVQSARVAVPYVTDPKAVVRISGI